MLRREKACSPLLCVENGPVKRTGELGRNQTIFNTGKTPVSSVRARCFGCGRTERPLGLAVPLNKVRQPGRGGGFMDGASVWRTREVLWVRQDGKTIRDCHT